MNQAVNYALENHLSIKKSSLELQKSIQQKKETQGIGLPQINAEGVLTIFLICPFKHYLHHFLILLLQKMKLLLLEPGKNTNAALQINQLLFNGSYIVGLEFSRF